MEIEYNVPFEVTKEQYNKIMNNFAGIVAGRKDNDKYFIKVWLMKYVNNIKLVLLTT